MHQSLRWALQAHAGVEIGRHTVNMNIDRSSPERREPASNVAFTPCQARLACGDKELAAQSPGVRSPSMEPESAPVMLRKLSASPAWQGHPCAVETCWTGSTSHVCVCLLRVPSAEGGWVPFKGNLREVGGCPSMPGWVPGPWWDPPLCRKRSPGEGEGEGAGGGVLLVGGLKPPKAGSGSAVSPPTHTWLGV